MKWISVKERLPEIDLYVLIFCPKSSIQIASLQRRCDSYNLQWILDQPCDEYSADGFVTHWMPLPDFPEDKS